MESCLSYQRADILDSFVILTFVNNVQCDTTVPEKVLERHSRGQRVVLVQLKEQNNFLYSRQNIWWALLAMLHELVGAFSNRWRLQL